MRICLLWLVSYFFFFKQKTAYEMRISDWSSDVCSSDLHLPSGEHDGPKDGSSSPSSVSCGPSCTRRYFLFSQLKSTASRAMRLTAIGSLAASDRKSVV